MPEIIIEQNQNIIKYISMLQLPYSASLNNHIRNMISGIITTERKKLFLPSIKNLLPIEIETLAQDS